MLMQNLNVRTFNPKIDSDRRATPRAYHYTSPNGLMAILGTHSIRFTDCQFMNDKSEYIHIHKPLLKALDQLKEGLTSMDIKSVFDRYLDNTYHTKEVAFLKPSEDGLPIKILTHRYFIFCTSIGRDLLNMWNYYVKDEKYQGYNLGLDINKIEESFRVVTSKKVELIHGKVIYDETKQIDLLSENILRIHNEMAQKTKNCDVLDYDDIYMNATSLIDDYIQTARLFFKHEAFRREREYRYVIKLPTNITFEKDGPLSVGYDIKGGIIVPHCTLKIDETAVKSIRLSPMMEKELAQEGLERYLSHCGYHNVNIKQSEIPIRY